jgi:hypothetical protein
MTTSELAAAVCARLAHHYGPAADAGAAIAIQRELEAALGAATAELREAAYDYAHMIQVELYDRDDVAVHRAYERLRNALGQPVGLAPKPYVASAK